MPEDAQCHHEVRSLSFRPFKGPTGGPGGVNATLEIYNREHKVIPGLTCYYRKLLPPYLRLLYRLLNRLSMRVLGRRGVLEKLEQHRFVREAITSASPRVVFVAHDPWSAGRLYKAGRKYILAYHQQGSLCEEARSFGSHLSAAERDELVGLERAAFLNACRVVFPSCGACDSYMQSSLLTKEELASIRSKSVVVYNSCFVPENIVRPPEFSMVESLLGTDPHRKIILTVSSVTHLKGVDQIPEFLSHLENFRRDFVWVLCGAGHLEPDVIGSVKRLGLEGNFVHIPRRMPQEELTYLYRQAAYYLMMHRLSVFDLATLEAMASGCVPTLTAVGGNLEFNKENNVLFTEQLAHSLPFDDRFVRPLGEKNRRVFEQYFGPEALLRGYADIIEDVYHRCMAGRHGLESAEGKVGHELR